MFNWHKKESPLLGSLGLGGGIGSKTFVGGGYQYWIATLGGASSDFGNDIALDSSGNIFVVAYTQSDGAGGDEGYIAKYDNLGNLQWQRVLGGTGGDAFYGVAVDSSDNVCVCGHTSSEGAGSYDTLVVKYNNSGVLQWQKRSGDQYTDRLYSIGADSSDNLCSVGQVVSTTGTQGGNSVAYYVYTSSGSLTYSKAFTLPSFNQYGRGIATSGTDVYAIAHYDDQAAATRFEFWLAKINSSANIVWQRYLKTTSNNVTGAGVATDGSGNVYVAVYFVDGTNSTTVAKYNSSGSLQWQRKLTQTSYNITPTSIATDSDNNVYVTCNANGVGAVGNEMYIAKWNTSGTIQWQRALGGTGTDNSTGIKVIDGIMYIVGATQSAGEGGNDILIAKLPADGSLTGTYGSFTYQEVTAVTEAAGTLSSGSQSFSTDPYSPTSATSTLTDSASTLTSTLTIIS